MACVVFQSFVILRLLQLTYIAEKVFNSMLASQCFCLRILSKLFSFYFISRDSHGNTNMYHVNVKNITEQYIIDLEGFSSSRVKDNSDLQATLCVQPRVRCEYLFTIPIHPLLVSPCDFLSFTPCVLSVFPRAIPL